MNAKQRRKAKRAFSKKLYGIEVRSGWGAGPAAEYVTVHLTIEQMRRALEAPGARGWSR